MTSVRDAARLIEKGDPTRAIPILERLVSSAPGYLTARVLLAQAIESTGNVEAAAEHWHGLLILQPHNSMIQRGVERATRQVAELRPTAGSSDTFEAGTGAADGGDPESEGGSDRVTDTPAAARSGTTLEEGDDSEHEEANRSIDDLPIANTAGLEEDFAREESSGIMDENISNLDQLIEQLENAPRIVPRPAPHFGDEDDGEDLMEDSEESDLVSETLARIYEKQGKFEEAVRAYQALARQEPARASEFIRKAEELNARHSGD